VQGSEASTNEILAIAPSTNKIALFSSSILIPVSGNLLRVQTLLAEAAFLITLWNSELRSTRKSQTFLTRWTRLDNLVRAVHEAGHSHQGNPEVGNIRQQIPRRKSHPLLRGMRSKKYGCPEK
jgi:hypothetical protein